MAQRPQANTNLGQPELVRTVARPSRDAAPTYTPKASRAGALAQSLLSIAPTLKGYAEEFHQVYQENEENRAYDEIQGMTFDDAQAAVQNGTLRDTESPWYQAAFEKQFGTVYAGNRRRELVEAYNNEFDKHNGNLDEFIAEFAGQDLDKFGGSEFIMSGYRNTMGGTLGQLRDQHAEWKSTWTRERVGENFGTLAYDAVTTAAAEGGDLNAALNALKGEHQGAFGMTFAEMDTNIFGMASRLASEGNVDALEQLLNTEIVGPDGTVVGSYMTRPKYAEEAAMHLAEARSVAGAAAREENTATVVGLQQQAAAGQLDLETAAQLRDNEQITIGEYERLFKANSDARVSATITANNAAQLDSLRVSALQAVMSGQGYAIQDYTYVDASGKERTATREKMIEDAVVGSMNELASRETPPGVMAEQLSSYGVDVTYPVWENLMSDGFLTLTEAASTGENGETTIPETAMSAYATYKALGETPQLRSRHINNTDAENVWSTAFMLEQMGVSPEDALMRASKPATAAGSAAANSFGRQEFEALSNSIQPGMFGDDLANGAAALGQTEALAKFYISHGVPKKQAVEAAIEDYDNSHTTINGVSVNTRNIHLPSHFEESSVMALDEFAELHGEDADDLTLIPTHDGSNNWAIAYKGNVAMPVQIMGADNIIHTSEIERTYQRAQEIAAQLALEAAQEVIKNRGEEKAVVEQTVAGFQEWQQMSRSERREAGLPTSIMGAQRHFSVNRALDERETEIMVEEKTELRDQMQSPEADALFEQMGLANPLNN